MAQFSDTTNKNGLIQKFERYTRMKDGDVTGTLLKQVTDMINEAFEDIMPILLLNSNKVYWDDVNHTDAPIGYVNIVSNQNDYKITEDDNSLDILNLTNVRILQSATDTKYIELKRITIDNSRVPEILSPDTTITGVPMGFLEVGNRLYLDVLPDYAATKGIELFFSREQEYFSATGNDSKEAGIPKPFHALLAMYAAQEWITVNRPNDTITIKRLEVKIRKREDNLMKLTKLRNRTKHIMTPKKIMYI